jgi:stage II sporulation protein AA (anti-sigma F factor antagonist)
MKLSVISSDDNLLHVRCEGTISQNEFTDETEPLRELLASQSGPRQKVILDLERATFIDSSGIGWLLICHKRLRENGGELIIHSVPPLIEQVLDLVKLPKIIHVSLDAAGARAYALGAKS